MIRQVQLLHNTVTKYPGHSAEYLDTTKLIISQRVSRSVLPWMIIVNGWRWDKLGGCSTDIKSSQIYNEFMLLNKRQRWFRWSCIITGTNGKKKPGPAQKVEDSGQFIKTIRCIIFKKYKFQMIIEQCILVSVLANVQVHCLYRILLTITSTPIDSERRMTSDRCAGA